MVGGSNPSGRARTTTPRPKSGFLKVRRVTSGTVSSGSDRLTGLPWFEGRVRLSQGNLAGVDYLGDQRVTVKQGNDGAIWLAAL